MLCTLCNDMQQGQGTYGSGQDPKMQMLSPHMSPSSSLVVQLLCAPHLIRCSAGALAAHQREGGGMPQR